MLLAHKANLHFAEPFGGNTPLHAFAAEGFAEVHPYALHAHVLVYRTCVRTAACAYTPHAHALPMPMPMHMHMHMHMLQVVERLLQAGAPTSALNEAQRTPQQEAVHALQQLDSQAGASGTRRDMLELTIALFDLGG